MYVSYIFVIQRLTTIYNWRVFRLTTILVAIRICKKEVLWLTADTQFNCSVVGQHLPVLVLFTASGLWYSCLFSLHINPHLCLLPGGLINTWKRRWCVLKDETFLWFRSKQEALKQGWLHKKGGGSSTLSRRNWKKRWFVLRQSKLMYFENDSEEKLKGAMDVRTAK